MNVTSNSVNVTGVSNVTEWPAGEDGYYYDYDYADPCGLHDRGSWLHRIVKPVVYSTGIVGIVLTVVVLSRKTMCTSTNCYLTALAIADLIILLVLSAQIVMEQGIDCQPLQESLLTAIDHVLVIVNNIALFASVWLTVMLAVERYIAICHPLQAMTICTTTRARALIAAIFIIAVIIRAPNFWDFTLRHQRFLTPDNVTMEQAVLEWQHDAYNMPVYTLIVSGIMAGLLPLLALAGLNIRLVVEIRQSTRYLRYHLAADSRIQSVFHDVALINLAIKSACNFILYCWFSEKFWNTFKQIFCLRHCLPEQPLVRNGHTNGNTNNHRPSCFVTRETTC
ncbi:hypothetical protein BaRGS_00019033 [Batillaria attramentaria]|uniref:G-protein coupled receptors family 1 profile domain-containing protein n=1 Tax=Batillaria attramentaria TaxID=370345 RepID=A0ABD0KQV5_9CAEN